MQSSTASAATSAAKSAPAAQGMPLIGDKFPQIEVQTTHGKMTLPDAFSGKWFVLFSHPADFTPVCTTEFVAFAKLYDQFKKLDCELLSLIHISEPTRLLSISYAVFCLKKKKNKQKRHNTNLKKNKKKTKKNKKKRRN